MFNFWILPNIASPKVCQSTEMWSEKSGSVVSAMLVPAGWIENPEAF